MKIDLFVALVTWNANAVNLEHYMNNMVHESFQKDVLLPQIADSSQDAMIQKASRRFAQVDAVKEPHDIGVFAQLVAELLANNRKKDYLYKLGETLAQTKPVH